MEDVLKVLLEERYLLAAVLAAILIMLLTERGLATSKRMLEWKERAIRYEEEKREAEIALRANTDAVERMADALSEQTRINEAILRDRR